MVTASGLAWVSATVACVLRTIGLRLLITWTKRPAGKARCLPRAARRSSGSLAVSAGVRFLAGREGHHVLPFGMLLVAGTDVRAQRKDLEATAARIRDQVVDQRRRHTGTPQAVGGAGVIGADEPGTAVGIGQLGLRIDAGHPGGVAAVVRAVLLGDRDFTHPSALPL